ncbi:YbhB/YbcL family Raf kinase inhibitor-like protein [Mesorhizobium sp. AR07]|uniref:YbhB/YbcL family Raf kinase inhibitor-like protein n=1 Tax=Mesorhizobium sp. AR07 TaxID=2865838 RepID=UPI00215EA904|nr:YbhB/YbcL family Raf kinase inhibitor-like protein [Mesorhizobium sp. AR07]
MTIHQNIKSSPPHDRQGSPAGRRRQPMLARAAMSIAAAFVAATLGGFAGKAEAGSKFTLSSPDLSSGSFETRFTLNGFGCTGSNVSPALQWANIPAGTKSLALQVRDRDAPTGSGLWHWAVYNIPPTATGLAQGAGNSLSKLPAPAFGGTTDFLDTGVTGANGNYTGPCPSVGDKPHRYVFTLYAVAVDDVQAAAGIPKTGTTALYSFVLNKGLGSKLLGTASFTASYGH